MTSAKKQIIHPVLTIVLLVASLVVGADAIKKIGFHENQIDARHQEFKELESLSETLSENKAALNWLQEQAHPGNRLDDLMNEQLSRVQPDVVLRDVENVGDGWNVYRYDMRIEQISTEELSRFLVSCENARPPVRVSELQVTALRQEGESVMAQLSLAEIVPADIVSKQ